MELMKSEACVHVVTAERPNNPFHWCCPVHTAQGLCMIEGGKKVRQPEFMAGPQLSKSSKDPMPVLELVMALLEPCRTKNGSHFLSCFFS